MEITSKERKLLSKHNLRITPNRELVLSSFFNKKTALSNQDIEQSIDADMDRVTLYRTLQKFLENGIIHQIESDGNTYYALCQGCEVHEHDDNHLHFKCTNCDTIKCIEQDEKISFDIPKGFKINSMKILLEGVCPDCP